MRVRLGFGPIIYSRRKKIEMFPCPASMRPDPCLPRGLNGNNTFSAVLMPQKFIKQINL
jgi:hypothetical protein